MGELGVCVLSKRGSHVCVRARRILPVCTFCLGNDSAAFYHARILFSFLFTSIFELFY